MQPTHRICAAVIILGLAILLSGVSPTQSKSQSKHPYQRVGNEGSVSGVISFSGRPPARKRIAMDADPSCVKANSRALTEDTLVVRGRLANVLVYVKSGSALSDLTFDTPPTPVVLDQRGCRYAPHVLGARVNQVLEVRNSDPTIHNVHPTPKNNVQWNQSQMIMGPPLRVTFAHSEVAVPIKCDQHPWMKAYLGVFAHPFFMVSDRTGRFTIEGLPSGNYTIVAWHERFGEKTVDVTITSQSSQSANFEFSALDDRWAPSRVIRPGRLP